MVPWRVEALPEPSALACRSMFRARDGGRLPEFDALAIPPCELALTRAGRNRARLVEEVRPGPGWPFPRPGQPSPSA